MKISKRKIILLVCLERIQYIQRCENGHFGRSARNCTQSQVNSFKDYSQRLIEIYYSTDHPRSEYLYKTATFQLFLPGGCQSNVVIGDSLVFRGEFR